MNPTVLEQLRALLTEAGHAYADAHTERLHTSAVYASGRCDAFEEAIAIIESGAPIMTVDELKERTGG